jgi:hypothetical protein
LMLEEANTVVAMVASQQYQQQVEEEKQNNVPITTATASIKNIPMAVTIWWDLCYDAIVNNIQQLVYQKLCPPPSILPSKEQTPIRKAIEPLTILLLFVPLHATVNEIDYHCRRRLVPPEDATTEIVIITMETLTIPKVIVLVAIA